MTSSTFGVGSPVPGAVLLVDSAAEELVWGLGVRVRVLGFRVWG